MIKSRKKGKSRIKIKWQMAVTIAAIFTFIGAFIYYFLNTYIETEREYTVYSTMEEPQLPVITAVVNGYDINPMHGYLQDMGSLAASESITPIPEDRRLEFKINLYGARAAGMSYEIRSIDTKHFIESTIIDEYEENESGETIITLPIQNLIKRDTPYMLNFRIELGEQSINYYTRIIWPGDDNIYRIIETAAEFTEKSFDEEAARELTVYMETDPAEDNSSLGTVGIRSSFSQITWGKTDMELISEPLVTVKEYDGIMGEVKISYISSSMNQSGNTDQYNNSDNYTMRVGSERIFIMNFERKTEQIFSGSKYSFLGKRINLGITNEESIQTLKSENGRYVIFKCGKELWAYDRNDKSAVNIFSYRSEKDTVRASYDQHDIKIISVTDEGETDFAVYGYINRGRHEGYNGLIYYRYDDKTGILSEIFFIPIKNNYENIKSELDEMLKKSSTGMVYIKQNETITAIDLNSLEMMDVISDLTEKSYAISDDQTEIAWIEGEVYTSNTIKLLNTVTGNTNTIGAGPGEILSILDFYNNDLIYGINNLSDIAGSDVRMTEIPVSKLIIVDPDQQNALEYIKEGLYFDEIIIENGRIHIGQYRLNEETGRYRFAGRDTIVCSERQEEIYRNDVYTDLNDIKGKIYYIELDENIKTTRSLKINSPNKISYENAGTIELNAERNSAAMRYYAYANGKLKGITYNIKEAIDLIYDDMGWVKDINSAMLYSRSDRASQKTVSEPVNAARPMIETLEEEDELDVITDDGYIVMDAYGIQINRLLYYVYKGCPVMAYLDNGDYCLVYGYTPDTVYVYYTTGEEDGNNVTMTLDEAALYFDQYQNNFVVFRDYQGNQ